MPRFFSVAELEERKHALVEQSEIYRQTLRFEAENLRACAAGLTRKVNTVRSFNPLIMMAAPLLKSIFQRKLRKSKLGLIAKGFMLWRLYRQFSPLLRNVFSRSHNAHSNGARYESVGE